MGKGGAPHAALSEIRNRYPVFVHGVGLSIGSPGELDKVHLARLKCVIDRYEPMIVSEHLAWSTHDTTYYNDLLPVPYTSEVQDMVVRHIQQVQDAIQRPMLLENPSTYVTYSASTMSETDFIRGVQAKTGCGLLLDLNNVFISAVNHGYSAQRYLEDFPLAHVREIHLAGHAADQDSEGRLLLIDAHDRAVSADVWRLFEAIVAKIGPVPTLIEWDNDVPAWNILKSEACAADAIMAKHSQWMKHAS